MLKDFLKFFLGGSTLSKKDLKALRNVKLEDKRINKTTKSPVTVLVKCLSRSDDYLTFLHIWRVDDDQS